jgi:hypothetical protein
LQPFWFVIFIPLSTHSSPTNPLLSTILVSDIHTFIEPFFSHKSSPSKYFLSSISTTSTYPSFVCLYWTYNTKLIR